MATKELTDEHRQALIDGREARQAEQSAKRQAKLVIGKYSMYHFDAYNWVIEVEGKEDERKHYPYPDSAMKVLWKMLVGDALVSTRRQADDLKSLIDAVDGAESRIVSAMTTWMEENDIRRTE